MLDDNEMSMLGEEVRDIQKRLVRFLVEGKLNPNAALLGLLNTAALMACQMDMPKDLLLKITGAIFARAAIVDDLMTNPNPGAPRS